MGDHVHARTGGGEATHDHAFEPGDGHSHDGLMPFKGAELDAAARADLQDSDYAYIDSKGGRHLPVNDEAHVRAALSRFNQTHFESPAKKAAAARKVRAKAKSLGIDVADDSAVAQAVKASEPTVVALRFRERTDLAEKEIPFLVTGEWHWPDYGKFTVTRDDLSEVYQHFRDNVRQQDLPVLNADHANPADFPGAAIGWVQDLEMRDPDTLIAKVDFNSIGDELIAKDQFRYVSPELLRNYTDAETGRQYRLVAAGLDCSVDNRSMCAVTNFPRIKRLGRIAAGELAECVALRFGEVTATTPGKAFFAKLAEGDTSDGVVDPPEMSLAVPCCWAPPFSPVGRCPGFTRATGLVDGDNDQPGDVAGCCLLAVQCNGYAPVGDGDNDSGAGVASPPTYYYSPMGEGQQSTNRGDRRMGEHDQGQGATEGQTQAPAAVPIPPQPVAASEPPTPAPVALATGTADAAETRNLLKAAEHRQTQLAEELATERRKREELEARLNAAERAKVLDGYRTRIDALRDSNRVTPAVHEKLSASESLMRFAESGQDGFLDALEQLPGTAIPMAEIGKGGEPNHGQVDESRLVIRMNEIHAERSRINPKYTFQDAAKAAATEVYGTQGGK